MKNKEDDWQEAALFKKPWAHGGTGFRLCRQNLVLSCIRTGRCTKCVNVFDAH
ncbi:hypothetical protein HYZ41_00825 [archaeon]|nr:hypothetical protein [archaeon]